MFNITAQEKQFILTQRVVAVRLKKVDNKWHYKNFIITKDLKEYIKETYNQ